MNTYMVKIWFLNIKKFKAEVTAINEFQAMERAIKMHREFTCCGFDELYDSEKSSVKLIK